MPQRSKSENMSGISTAPTQRRKVQTNVQPNPITGKLPVAPPTSFGKFVVILAMHVCKKIVLVNTTTKLGIYTLGICGISLMTDLFPFPRTYFSSKGNFLNQYFVKIGWGWTCSLLGMFIYLTSHTYCAGDRRSINRHLARLAVGTGWWFVCTRLFDYIHANFGHCVGSAKEGEISDRAACEMAGKHWLAFDVSGHAFLLLHCLLMLSEELRVIANWERIDENAAEALKDPNPRYTPEQVERIRTSYATFTPYIRALLVALTLLTVIWEVMLTATAVYFHNFPQKIFGSFFAIIGWFLTYRMWYVAPVLESCSPGLPGKGVIRYQ